MSSTFSISGQATVVPRSISTAIFSSFAQSVVDIEANLGTAGTFAMSGSATVAIAGVGVTTYLALGAYTFEAVASSAFSATIRRNPDPTITNALGTTMSSMNCRVGGTVAPIGGQAATIDFGDGFGTLFQGVIQTVTQVFEGEATHLAWDLTIIGNIWSLNNQCPFGCWTNVSATTVVQALISAFAPGFASTHVEAALPVVTVKFDGTKTFIDCLNEIAQQIAPQGYFRVDGFDVWFFQTDSVDPPDPLNDSNLHLLYDPQIEYEVDYSQIRNRSTIAGASTTVVADVPIGATTIEVASIANGFTEAGYLTTGCQRPHHTGAIQTSISPARGNGSDNSAAQAIDPITGRVLSGKIHIGVEYAVSKIDGSNESDLGTRERPFQYVPWGAIAGTFASASASTGGNIPMTGEIRWAISVVTPDGQTTMWGIFVVNPPVGNAYLITANPFWPDQRTSGLNIWRTKTNGSAYYYIGSITTPGGSFLDTNADANLTQQFPFDAFGISGTESAYDTTGAQVDITLPNDGSAHRIYRALGDIYGVNYGDLFRLADVPEGVTTYRDNAETPTWDVFQHDGDTSGGTSHPGPLPPVTRSFLTGVTGVTEVIPKGTKIQLFVQVDNTSSQAAFAMKFGGTGIREFPLVSDEALTSYSAMTSRGTTQNRIFGNPIETLRFSSFSDTKLKPGKDLAVNLTHPPIVTTLKVQSATLDLIRFSPGKAPRYAVVAASIKYTLNDFLRNTVLTS